MSLYLVLSISSARLMASATETDIRFKEEYIRAGIERMPSIANVRYQPEMVDIIQSYVKSSGTPEFLRRSEMYFPIIEHLLESHGMPDDLKYLAVIESHLEPTALSHQGAKGIWQFMQGTGRMMGLKVSRQFDQRMDPWASTEAALLYLQQLYDTYGDWSLAMAAYNCGPGNVNKAIRKAGANDYWEIRPYLPKETRRYLPKFIAASYFLQNLETYGFFLSGLTNDIAVVKVYERTSLADIATLANLPAADIQKYNPAYLNQNIPSSHVGYNVLIPFAQAENFIHAYKQHHPEARQPDILSYGLQTERGKMRYQVRYEAIRVRDLVEQHHRIRSGDNLYDIGRAYGISVAKLKRINGLRGTLIHPGRRLLIRQERMVTRYIPRLEPISLLQAPTPSDLHLEDSKFLNARVQDVQEQWWQDYSIPVKDNYIDVRAKYAAYLSLISLSE